MNGRMGRSSKTIKISVYKIRAASRGLTCAGHYTFNTFLLKGRSADSVCLYWIIDLDTCTFQFDR